MNTARKFFAIVLLGALSPHIGLATNGDNMIAIGPKARAMGGVSIAYPQDAITAVFGNPASLCFTKFCPSAQADFSVTLFMPKVQAEVTHPLNPSQSIIASSKDSVYPIPAIGVSLPFGEDDRGRFGLAAYGVSGLGVDYRSTELGGTIGSLAPPAMLDQIPPMFQEAPLIAGSFTNLQIMKIAPSVAWQVQPRLSFGVAAHIDYAVLDLGQRSSAGYGYGIQAGMVYRTSNDLSMGLVYTSPQEVEHERVISLGGPLQSLTLEAPQQVGFGFAKEYNEGRFVVAADLKWINWADAAGYDDFDWDDQMVYAIGFQFEPIIDRLVLRAGFNYGENPVKTHNGWNGSFNQEGMPNDVTVVQGIPMPTYFYETFRIIGFPAVVESHYTFGATYHTGDRFSFSLAYMLAPKTSIEETGIGPTGAPTTLSSTLEESSIELGLNWKF